MVRLTRLVMLARLAFSGQAQGPAPTGGVGQGLGCSPRPHGPQTVSQYEIGVTPTL